MTDDQVAAQVAAKLLGYLEMKSGMSGWADHFRMIAAAGTNDGVIMSAHTDVTAKLFLRSKTPWWDQVPELANYDKVAVLSNGRVLALTAYDPIIPLL